VVAHVAIRRPADLIQLESDAAASLEGAATLGKKASWMVMTE